MTFPDKEGWWYYTPRNGHPPAVVGVCVVDGVTWRERTDGVVGLVEVWGGDGEWEEAPSPDLVHQIVFGQACSAAGRDQLGKLSPGPRAHPGRRSTVLRYTDPKTRYTRGVGVDELGQDVARWLGERN